MGWTFLLIAGFFEIIFTYGLKLTHTSFKVLPVAMTAISAISSFVFLWLSLKTIPIGSAYAIWTGMGVIGAAVMGIVQFNEPATPARLVCILMIAAGGIGLRLLGVEK